MTEPIDWIELIKDVPRFNAMRGNNPHLVPDFSFMNFSGANLHHADLHDVNLKGANLSNADIQGANLHSSDLRDANLSCAYFIGSDLRNANLNGANLSDSYFFGAYLRGANLRNTNLNGVRGIARELTTPLIMLLDQPGKIRAYKLVNTKMEGTYKGGLRYVIGETMEEENANTDIRAHCGSGINLATLDWCLKEWEPGCTILICEFTAKDIAAIPVATDGKFRVFKCKVIGEKAIPVEFLKGAKE